MSIREHLTRYFSESMAAGLPYAVADNIRRDARRLHTWFEHECNGTVTRAEAGDVDHRGRPMKAGAKYAVCNIDGPGPLHYYRTRDRETGANNRIIAAVAQYLPHAELDFCGDPRGLPVRIKLVDGSTLCPPVRS